jgi:RecA-family ATPase
MARGALTNKQKKQLERDLPAPQPETKDAFIIRQAAEWLKPNPTASSPDKLFGDFWYRGELCILFADTNVGKSILAVQIGNALSSGEPVQMLGATLPSEKVLYFDFELSTEQFECRYSSYRSSYAFNSNFYRVVLNPDAEGVHKFKNYADYMYNALENIIITTKARTLILDNITCLRSSTHAAENAIKLMRSLQAIKNRYGLSVLVLAHTPKRDNARPITRNDLQGSKMLINFADSAFALGESQTTLQLRYLKQIKQRSGKEHYGAANVCLCNIVKPGNFLQFEFTGFDDETAHLMNHKEQQSRNNEEKVARLHDQGLSVRAIAAQTGLSNGTVFRMVKKFGKGDV